MRTLLALTLTSLILVGNLSQQTLAQTPVSVQPRALRPPSQLVFQAQPETPEQPITPGQPLSPGQPIPAAMRTSGGTNQPEGFTNVAPTFTNYPPIDTNRMPAFTNYPPMYTNRAPADTNRTPTFPN